MRHRSFPQILIALLCARPGARAAKRLPKQVQSQAAEWVHRWILNHPP